MLLPALVASGASVAVAGDIVSAQFSGPTTRYDHAVLGDAVEWGGLDLRIASCRHCANPTWHTVRITLPADHVFEDIAPRLADIDFDGDNEVIVVETDIRLGAALAIYDASGKIAETPHIGRSHRWLAPLGAADLDGDGKTVELAYIDRPHLAKTLRIWRYVNGTLIPIADHSGLTNHRIGEAHISGGIRHCGPRPEIITANSTWTRLIASTLTNGKITTRDIGPHTGPASFTAAMACR